MIGNWYLLKNSFVRSSCQNWEILHRYLKNWKILRGKNAEKYSYMNWIPYLKRMNTMQQANLFV